MVIGRLISSGMGAARSTEANLRKLFFDTKENLTQLLVSEVKRFLAEIDIPNELRKALSSLRLEVKASVKVHSPEGDVTLRTPRKRPKAKRGK